MNAPARFFLPDTQSLPDPRRLAIQRVGIRGLRYPVTIATADGRGQPTVAEFTMTVGLPHDVKGTHMSRQTTSRLWSWQRRWRRPPAAPNR